MSNTSKPMKMKTRTFQEVLDSTKRTQHVDRAIVNEVKPPKKINLDLEFFHIGKYITDDELEKEFGQRKLVACDPYTLALYAEKYPDFADKKLIATHFKSKDGNWCFATFDRWVGKRYVYVYRHDYDWSDSWWFAGRRKLDLDLTPLDSVSLSVLDSAIKICKDNGLKVIKEL